MIHKYLLGGAVMLGVWGAALGTAGAAAKNCKSPGSAYGNIKVTNTDCATAYKVIHADTRGKKYGTWRCTSKRYNAGATVTCTHKPHEKITYQIAD